MEQREKLHISGFSSPAFVKLFPAYAFCCRRLAERSDLSEEPFNFHFIFIAFLCVCVLSRPHIFRWLTLFHPTQINRLSFTYYLPVTYLSVNNFHLQYSSNVIFSLVLLCYLMSSRFLSCRCFLQKFSLVIVSLVHLGSKFSGFGLEFSNILIVFYCLCVFWIVS